MSETLVKHIDGLNPHSVIPEECLLWKAHLDTLLNTGIERVEGNEIQHTLIAEHPGTGHKVKAIIYIKSS